MLSVSVPIDKVTFELAHDGLAKWQILIFDASMPTNCIDAFNGLAQKAVPQQRTTLRLRSLPGAPFDALIRVRGDNRARQDEGHRALLPALADASWVAEVKVNRDSLGVTFTDELVREWSDALQHGELATVWASSDVANRHFAVQFLDPNLTKALHVGHFWNMSLGEALASIIETAGGQVTRRVWCTDIGRSMFEALAGVADACQAQLSVPPHIKPDHFVGQCYANYVNGAQMATQGTPCSPIDNELAYFHDRAEDLMARWLEGDSTIRAQLQLVREWVHSGQQATLNRVGVRFDDALYQSDCLQDVDQLIRRGLSKGLLHRRDDGSIAFCSQRPGHEHLTLVRPDGFPTEYARAIAMIWRDQPLANTYDAVVGVAGDEWQPPASLFKEFLTRLEPCPLFDKVKLIYHHMLTLQGTKMKSRDGGAILIDDMFDRLICEPRLRNVYQQHDWAESADLIANLVVRVFLLTRNPRRNIAFSWDDILDEQRNPGWFVCQTLCLLRSPESQTKIGGEDEELARLVIARAQEYPSRLLAAIERFDVRIVVKYLLEVCALCGELPRGGDSINMGRTLVEGILVALGLPLETSVRQGLALPGIEHS